MSDFRTALQALDAAGLRHCVRNGGGRIEDLPPSADLDVLVTRADRGAAGRALEQAGFSRLSAPGHRGHRFYVALDDAGCWRKIDVVSALRYGSLTLPVEPVLAARRLLDGVWVASEADEQAHRDRRAAGLREPQTRLRDLARKRPAGVRRRGPVIAVLGPDGAGKGSTLDGVAAHLPVGVTRLYLGSTRSSRAESAAAGGPPPAAPVRPRLHRELPFLVRRSARVWGGLASGYAASWAGHVVLCDRHPVEVLAIQPERTRIGRVLERLLLVQLLPTPDRVVVLDAPGEVLFRRKGEHDPALLERWRQAYLVTFVPPGVVVPTTGALSDSVTSLLGVIWQELSRRNGWPDLETPSRPSDASSAS